MLPTTKINLSCVNISHHQITGQYSVLLPDGRVQTVTYSVSPNSGFVVSPVVTEVTVVTESRGGAMSVTDIHTDGRTELFVSTI